MAVIGPQYPKQVGATETYSRHILGPTFFELCNLRVEGQAGLPNFPDVVAPGQSPYIIASNETFKASLDIKFNNTPLTQLLLCLGIDITVCFSFEGVGAKAVEKDLEATITTKEGQLEYTLTYEGTAQEAGLTPGLYAIGAVVQVGPGKHKCAQYIFGYGYIAKSMLQVY